MISHEHRCIIVHIPRTGGTSVEDVIWGPDCSVRTADQLWMGYVRRGYNKYQSGGMQHLLASQIREEVGEEVFNTYFKFAFVRNPWDKAVSQFHYLKKRKDLLEWFGMHRWTSFRKYLSLMRKHEHVQCFEQWRFLYDDDGKQLVDFLGRFEALENDFKKVADRIGLGHAALPHKMRSQRRPYTAYYDAESRDMLAEMYQRDIELFGYSFGAAVETNP